MLGPGDRTEKQYGQPTEQEAKARQELLLAQFRECCADIRQYDAMLWQLPAAIGAIVGLTLNFAGQALAAGSATWIHVGGEFLALLLTVPLVLALYKNRLFQRSRNQFRSILVKAIQLHARNPNEPDAALPALEEREDKVGLAGLFPIHSLALGQLPGPPRFRHLRAYDFLFSASVLMLAGHLGLLITLFIKVIGV